MRVSIAGASGYAGGELLRLFESHPDFEVVAAAAHSSAGARVDSVHPALAPSSVGSLEFCPASADQLQADVVFIALPHGQSALLAAELLGVNPHQMIVDLGADFRLADSHAWKRYYGGEHAGTWTYGLPELAYQREIISESSTIANPGCYATAISLACAPAIAAHLMGGSAISVVAASGTTGAGRVPTPSLIASAVMGSMSAYKIGGIHQHTPEVEQVFESIWPGANTRISFTPLLAPMPRGIIATCTSALPEDAVGDPQKIYRDYFKDSPFVRVLNEGQMPSTGSVIGSNYVQLSVSVDQHSNQLIVIATLDNLVKGAAGQAIQNANLMCGFAETTGLLQTGIAP
jgi:N-acetyl-gamma-glutamyl-phosphate reductase